MSKKVNVVLCCLLFLTSFLSFSAKPRKLASEQDSARTLSIFHHLVVMLQAKFGLSMPDEGDYLTLDQAADGVLIRLNAQRNSMIGQYSASYLALAVIKGVAGTLGLFVLYGLAFKCWLRVNSEWHSPIQDVFNEFNVLILSPNFVNPPENAVMVTRDNGFTVPALQSGKQ